MMFKKPIKIKSNTQIKGSERKTFKDLLLKSFPNLTEQDNLSNNKAAIAVGVASQSSASMALANSRGKCVIIYHFYGDNLCTLEGMPILPLPSLGPLEWLKLKNFDDDFPPLGTTPSTTVINEDTKVQEEEVEESVEIGSREHVTEGLGNEAVETDMDDILNHCFLGAIKYSKLSLPEGIITLKEIKKGVEAISAINKDHPKYSQFYISPENRPACSKDLASGEVASTTNVTESYIITQNVLPIFQPEGYQKGDTIGGSNIRKVVTKYVKDNNLQDEENARLVRPKDKYKVPKKYIQGLENAPKKKK
ncbi:hypothetical protein NQ318_006133 [Aromia moschata]|uniref:Uncharacterized protein n=1 Tax=Aromia moschata TaxID=1265417 RepID=A0AAV8XNA1_9CUCU|nr:hypothetical protein NQ318_006133 [Aromia moschata]